LDPGAKAIVHQLRDLPQPAGVSDVHVGGYTAEVVDRLSDLGARLPWMALIVALATFVPLFLAFGSVVVPLKAIVMNILSMAATFGLVTWIFQDGHLSGLLNFTPTGTIDATQPILVLAVVFGLSMDYEVFLLFGDVHQADRRRDVPRHPHRRDDRPIGAGAGNHAGARRRQLVGSGAVTPLLPPPRAARERRGRLRWR
jgi:trehalose monomycolate/heme transporter